MKIVVSELPKTPSECPFSEWKPYPPFIEEPGYWYCTFCEKDKRKCEIDENNHQCLWLVQIPPQTQW